jgi:lysophospholipase L1-like esterase
VIERDLTLSQPVRIPCVGAAGYKIAAGVLGVVAALMLGEILLWFVLPSQAQYYVWPPHFQSTLRPDPSNMPGISGDALFKINSAGIRGDELTDSQTYRILAVGGSTTECLYLDQTEGWTSLLQKKLSDANSKSIWVGNLGKSGHNTRHHLLQLKYYLPQLPRIDAVILLVGVNDVHIRISDLEYDPDATVKPTFESEYMRAAFAVSPPDLPVLHFKRSGWWRLAKKLKDGYLTTAKALPVQDATGQAVSQWRRYRRNAEEIVDASPDLSAALGEYRRNLDTIIDLSLHRGVRPILVTQPALWRHGMTQEDLDLLWMGGIGSFQLGKGHKYYSAAALDSIMQQYNKTLLEICRNRTVDCIDLARILPKDRTVFYDDVHFNESGAAQVAQVLYEHIAPKVP